MDQKRLKGLRKVYIDSGLLGYKRFVTEQVLDIIARKKEPKKRIYYIKNVKIIFFLN